MLDGSSKAQKTRTHDNGGTKPVWKQDLAFVVTAKTQFMVVNAFDEGVTGDSPIGNTKVRD